MLGTSSQAIIGKVSSLSPSCSGILKKNLTFVSFFSTVSANAETGV
jgi:hypothetical protein